MCAVQEAFCEAFPDSIRNVYIEPRVSNNTFNGYKDVYDVRIILTFPEYELRRDREMMNFIIEELSFAQYHPCNISQTQRLDSAYLTRDVIVYYRVNDLELFAQTIKSQIWERFNRKISAEIDRTINENN